MATKRRYLPLTTLDGLFALLPPGGHAVVRMPDAYVGRALVPALLASGRAGRTVQILTGSGASPEPESSVAALGAIRTGDKALALLKTLCSKRARGFAFDFSSEVPHWQSSGRARVKFLHAAVAELRKRKSSSVWFYSASLLADNEWARLKDEADACVVFEVSGSMIYLQLVSAKSNFDVEQYLPRPVEVRDGKLSIGLPVRPSHETLEPSEKVLRLQQRLEDTEKARGFLFASFPLPQAVFTRGKLAEANEAFYRLFSWVERDSSSRLTPHAFFGKKNVRFVRELFPPVAGPGSETGEQAQGAIRESVGPREVRFHTPDGNLLDLEVTALSLPSEPTPAFLCTFVDLTHRVARFDALERSEMFLRSLLDSTAGAVALVREGKFAYASRGFLEVLGYLFPEELVGKEIGPSIHSRDRKAMTEKLDPACRAAGVVDHVDFLGLRRDGASISLSAALQTIGDGGATVCFVRDRSGELRAEDERRRRSWETETVSHIMLTVRDARTLADLYAFSLQAVLKRLDFDAGGLYAIGDDGATLSMVASQELPANILEGLSAQSVVEGVTGYAAKTQEPVVLKVAEYPPYLPYRSVFESAQVACVVYVPLLFRDTLEGLLMLVSRGEPDGSSLAPGLLESLGRHIGSAVANAKELERVRQTEERYRSAIETVKDVVYQALPSGNLLFISPRVERLVGYTLAEVMRSGDAWRNIVHPDDRAEYSRRVGESAAGTDGVDLEYRVLPKGKAAYLRVRDSVRYRRDDQGHLLTINGIITVISEPGEPPPPASGPSEALRPVLDAMGDALIITDLEGTIREVNREFTSLTGFSRQNVLGVKFPYPWLVEDDMARMVEWISALREKLSLRDFDMRWRSVDGREILISLNTTLLHATTGEPVAMLNIARDITERRRLAGQVQLLYEMSTGLVGTLELKSLLRLVFDELVAAMPVDALTYDEGAGPFRRVAEVAGGEVRMSMPATPVDVADGSPLFDAVSRRRAVLAVSPDGAAMMATPVMSKGEVAGILSVSVGHPGAYSEANLRLFESIGNLAGVAYDRILLYEDALAKSSEIEQRNMELDDFAYVASHDLKEPLITIEGYSKVLSSDYADRLDEEGRKYIGSIIQSSARMKRLIEDLLTLARIGRSTEQQEQIPLSDLLDDVVRDFEFTLSQRNASIEYRRDLPVVRYNRTHLGMVFRNLISNGLKFNTHPSPTARIGVEESPDHLVVSVADNGIGIERDDFEKIFGIFNRASPREQFEGTGAGLAIVRNIVEHHRGKVWLESTPGMGTTFFFSVPK